MATRTFDAVNTQLATELMAAWNAHDLDRAAAFYASDYVGLDVSEPGRQHGPAGIRKSLERYLQAFPDLFFNQEALVVQGDQVALVWRAQATHRGRLMNIPPTGRAIDVQGTSFLTIREGKVWRALYVWDVAGLLRTIGLLPELTV